MLPVKLRFVGQTHVGFLNQVRDLQAGTLILKQAPGEAAKFPISPGSQTGKRGLGRPWPRRGLVACGPAARRLQFRSHADVVPIYARDRKRKLSIRLNTPFATRTLQALAMARLRQHRGY